MRLHLDFLLRPWGCSAVSQGQAASAVRGLKGCFPFGLYVLSCDPPEDGKFLAWMSKTKYTTSKTFMLSFFFVIIK